MNKKRIMLVENHRILRNGLKKSLELDDSIEVVAEAGDGASAIKIAENNKVDVIFMDINLSELNGMDASRQILKNNPIIKIIAISMHKDINYLKGMLEAGATGYMLKTCSGKSMSKAVETVLSGKKYFCPEIFDLILEYKVDVDNLKLEESFFPDQES